MRVLVVEDEVKMAALLRRGLSHDGFVVDVAGSGEDALWMAASTPYDAVILDVMLPGIDGFEVCRRLRADGMWAPVLLLTARDAVAHRVEGLDAGADDYLTKPFAVAELFGRIERLLERPRRLRPTVLRCGDLSLDPARHTVARGDVAFRLSTKEFALLHELMRHAGHALTRSHLMDHLWDFSYDGDSNVIDVYIGYLRDKVDRPFGRHSIETVRGVGYRLRQETADSPLAKGVER